MRFFKKVRKNSDALFNKKRPKTQMDFLTNISHLCPKTSYTYLFNIFLVHLKSILKVFDKTF